MKAIKLLLIATLLYAAQYILGEVLQMYRDDTLKTDPSAIAFLREQADLGDADAAFLLATAYRNGKTGQIDLNKARRWYRHAAYLGDADAMLMLGWLYYKEPKNLPSNLKKARYWFRKAAEEGVDEAVEMLSLLEG